MDAKKKIIIIEDDLAKREDLTWYFKQINVEFLCFEFTNPALNYIVNNKDNIMGIILDLGLQSMPGVCDRSLFRGLDVVKELERKKIKIPILINSSTHIQNAHVHPYVYAQREEVLGDYDLLDEFVAYLT